MSQNDSFAGGFIVGALLGGVVGGVIGALATARIKNSTDSESNAFGDSGSLDELGGTDEASMEMARRGLEVKIAQLNSAIDDVREQLGGINGHPSSVSQDPSTIDSP